MKITSLEFERFLGISVFKVSKLGKVNVITGPNGSGKSSILKAIQETLRSSGRDAQLIKTGEDDSKLLLSLDNDAVVVERRITKTTNTVKVSVDGQPIDSPVAYLRTLFGDKTFNPFNPIEFFKASKKERMRLLLSSIPFVLESDKLAEHLGDLAKVIDLSKFDYSVHGLECLKQIQDKVYDMRHDQNVSLTRLKKSIEQDQQEIPDTFDGDKFSGFDVNTATEELVEREALIIEHKSRQEQLEGLRGRARTVQSQIEALQTELVEINLAGKQIATDVKVYVAPDIDSLKKQIADYHDHLNLAVIKKAIDRRRAEMAAERNRHLQLDTLHKQLTLEVPKELLAELNLPLKGLEIQGEDIFIDGIAIEKLCTSDQLKFWVRVARAVSGTLHAICCDRWESLDKNSLKAFLEETADDDFEYFITRVTDDAELKMEMSSPEVPDEKPKEEKPNLAPSKDRVDF